MHSLLLRARQIVGIGGFDYSGSFTRNRSGIGILDIVPRPIVINLSSAEEGVLCFGFFYRSYETNQTNHAMHRHSRVFFARRNTSP